MPHCLQSQLESLIYSSLSETRTEFALLSLKGNECNTRRVEVRERQKVLHTTLCIVRFLLNVLSLIERFSFIKFI